MKFNPMAMGLIVIQVAVYACILNRPRFMGYRKIDTTCSTGLGDNVLQGYINKYNTLQALLSAKVFEKDPIYNIIDIDIIYIMTLYIIIIS